MKKIISLSLVILFIIVKANAQAPVDSMSLNGVVKSKALTMIKTYGDYIDVSSNSFTIKQQSVWFDKSTFKQMIDLVNQAKKVQPLIDGIRIYFGLDGDPNGSFTFQLIIVATVSSGINPHEPSGKWHKDYYFDPNNPLFQSKYIQGKTFLRGVVRRGDLLYKPSDTTTDIKCDTGGPHYISRQDAEKWVDNFGASKMTTKAEWFDLDLMNAFTSDLVHDGIRIYFAKHNSTDTDPFQDVASKDMFIFVTTKRHGLPLVYSHLDYFDCSITQATLSQLFTKKKAFFKLNNMSFTGDGGTNPGGQDKGELCPNSCN